MCLVPSPEIDRSDRAQDGAYHRALGTGPSAVLVLTPFSNQMGPGCHDLGAPGVPEYQVRGIHQHHDIGSIDVSPPYNLAPGRLQLIKPLREHPPIPRRLSLYTLQRPARLRPTPAILNGTANGVTS